MLITICSRSAYRASRCTSRLKPPLRTTKASIILSRLPYRPFTSISRRRKDDPRKEEVQAATQKPLTQDGTVKIESVQKSKPASPAGQDPLLTERTVSDKEQRKADWAIIKEMSRYLWPKVMLSDMACKARIDLF